MFAHPFYIEAQIIGLDEGWFLFHYELRLLNTLHISSFVCGDKYEYVCLFYPYWWSEALIYREGVRYVKSMLPKKTM